MENNVSVIDDDVFANRAEPLKGEALPENTDAEMAEKQKTLSAEKSVIAATADKDIGNDGTDQTVFRVYRDKRKIQIQTVREKLMDEMLRAKVLKAGALIDGLEEKRLANAQKIDEAASSIKNSLKVVADVQTNLEREISSAEKYFRNLKNSRTSRKGGRRGGQRSS